MGKGKLRGKFRALLNDVQDSLGLSPLDKWLDKYETDTRTSTYYRWSPEWTQLTEQTWREYDELDAARRATSRPELEWQASISQAREARGKLLEHRRIVFSPMTPDKLRLAPLATYLDQFTGKSKEKMWDDRLVCWTAMLDNWSLFKTNMADKPDFVEGLSASQVSAFRILQDWWHCAYSDPSLVQTTVEFMESKRGEEVYDLPFNDPEIVKSTCMDSSLYHTDCLLLFFYEFHPRVWEPFESDRCIMHVQYHRQQASWMAICQRFAYSVANPSLSTKGLPYIKPIRTDNQWFERVDRDDQNRPYFLWDATLRKTVVVDELNHCPEYTCISHTWGRWRIKDQSFQIPGVAWLVPANTLYDVRELPHMLDRLGDRYIWFDLFCIPQIRGDKRAELEISRQAAIFRHSRRCVAWLNQCPGWKGVVDTLKWVAFTFLKSTTRDDEATKLYARSLSALTASMSGTIELMRYDSSSSAETFDPWFTSLWTLQETVLCPDIELYSRDWVRLQVNEREPLSLTTAAVFLSIAFLYCTSAQDNNIPFFRRPEYLKRAGELIAPGKGSWSLASYPSGVADLMGLVLWTQIDQVLTDLSPMRILATVGRRQYTERDRSHAIMSAIGVTDWYKARLGSNTPTTDDILVLGNFSLAFLRETAQKIGALFFGANVPTQRLIAKSAGHSGPGGFSSGNATMLPISNIDHEASSFSRGIGSAEGVASPEAFIDSEHPSVAGWTITATGGVEIRSAGIIAWSGASVPVICEQFDIHCMSNQGDGTVKQRIEGTGEPSDLTGRLADIAQGAMLYAVALTKSGQRQQGILLADLEVEDTLDSHLRHMVKVGTYTTTGVDLPPPTQVHWLVL